MDSKYLKSVLVYSYVTGVFTWIKPPPSHQELTGQKAGTVAETRRGKSYRVIQIDGEKYRCSHLAFLFMTGEMPSGIVDHINGDSLDDRWSNLRSTTHLVNAQNRKIGRRGRELPMGVRRSRSGSFAARITVSGQQIQLGTFSNVESAKHAYDMAKEKYHA